MTVRHPFTQQEINEICDLFLQGYTVSAIIKKIDSLKFRKAQTIYPILIKRGLYQKKTYFDRRRYYVDDSFFDVIDAPIKSYWLGFLLADGFIVNSGHSKYSIGISLKSSDAYILEQFRIDIKSNYSINTYVVKTSYSSCTYSRFLFRSRQIYDRLVKLGFINKSYHCKFPIEVIPLEFRNHFIRGYFDGNGCITCNSNTGSYSLKFCGCKEILSLLKSILNKDDLVLTSRFPDRNNNNYSFTISGNRQVLQTCDWMYCNAERFLIRKKEKYLFLKGKYNSPLL